MNKNKIAVIVTGSHAIGKTNTITEYIKPMFGLRGRERNFRYCGKKGTIRSQSFEEKRANVIDEFKKLKGFDILILAARPENENPSNLLELRGLLSGNGFVVKEVQITKKKDKEHQKEQAEIAFNYIKSHFE